MFIPAMLPLILRQARGRGVCLRRRRYHPSRRIWSLLAHQASGPNSHLVRRAGLKANQGRCGGQPTEGHLMPDFYAAGDVAEHRWSGLRNLGARRSIKGSIAGMNMAGSSVEFAGVPRSNTLKVPGVRPFQHRSVQSRRTPASALSRPRGRWPLLPLCLPRQSSRAGSVAGRHESCIHGKDGGRERHRITRNCSGNAQ